MQPLGLEHFVRWFKDELEAGNRGKFAFFLGSGCSISSGIPGARTLVEDWLSRLFRRITGKAGPPDKVWLKREFPAYDPANPAASYAAVMRKLFPLVAQRQQEIERIVGVKDPGFGYAVFAALISHETFGPKCNLVLTTNFDDMVADALYLYTQKKPLVIAHESLAGFAETGGTRPLVMKIHGDALLAPKNLESETCELDAAVRGVLTAQLKDRGLIFLGYGGNDTGVSSILQVLPAGALKWGVYWVNESPPGAELQRWLASRNDAWWVKHLKFDELMLLVRAEFGLAHPDEARFDRLMEAYRQTFETLTKEVEARAESKEKRLLRSAVEQAVSQAKDWWAVELEARKHEGSDPARAEGIYQAGIEKFPRSAPLLGNYAVFLEQVRKDFDQAEAYYKRALEADAKQATNLGNYAVFLKDVRKDFEQAEVYYQRALEADAKNATNLGNYALFLETVRKDFEQAEVYYQRALEADAKNATNLGNYALFLETVRKDFEQAEVYYQRALEADAKNATHLGNYAVFLETVREDFDQAEAYYQRALEADAKHANHLGSYAVFLETVREDFDQAEAYYQRALEADAKHTTNLGNYADFLEKTRKNYDEAERYYQLAVEADPARANNVRMYADFLKNVRKDAAAAEEYYRRSKEADSRHKDSG